jgi:hypothetical protein
MCIYIYAYSLYTVHNECICMCIYIYIHAHVVGLRLATNGVPVVGSPAFGTSSRQGFSRKTSWPGSKFKKNGGLTIKNDDFHGNFMGITMAIYHFLFTPFCSSWWCIWGEKKIV